MINQFPPRKRLKVDIYDGTGSLRDYFCQFELIARANGWEDGDKAVQLAANLRGKARAILDGWEETFGYEKLKDRLELRFGDRVLHQNSYVRFSSRKQKPGEDFASLGENLEQLARLAYPECTSEMQDKISCAQFIPAITDGFTKQTLQLENITSLRPAIERAFTIKAIQENSFPRQDIGFANINFGQT